MANHKKPSKENICLRALRAYGFLIDGPDDVLCEIKGWPKANEQETFSKWQRRAFGEKTDIIVYAPYTPQGNTKMSTLSRDCGGQHLERIFREHGQFKKKKAEEKVTTKFSTFPKETLFNLVDGTDKDLQKSVWEFFERYRDSADQDIGIEEILEKLINAYNNNVYSYNNLKARYDKLVKAVKSTSTSNTP